MPTSNVAANRPTRMMKMNTAREVVAVVPNASTNNRRGYLLHSFMRWLLDSMIGARLQVDKLLSALSDLIASLSAPLESDKSLKPDEADKRR
jgi:hypothetical protein